MVLSQQEKWLIIGLETAFLIILAVWMLSRLDVLFEPVALTVSLIIIAIGDIITALVMERYAPTKITIGPGEGPTLVARAERDFDSDGNGRIVLRGERWRACSDLQAAITAGTKIRVLYRTGLVLHVEALE